MQGYKRAFLATVATLLVANVAFAQTIPPVTAPIITTVTPGDASAIIGFVPSRVTEGTPPVREYVVSCEQPGNSNAGIIESTADVQTLLGNQVNVQGLTNGENYQCTMVARAVTGGLVPRAINSDPSNPTPIFSPSPSGSPTIFVNQPGATAPVAPPAPESQPAVVGPIVDQPAGPREPVVAAPAPAPAPEREAVAAVLPLVVEAPAKEPAPEVVTAPIIDVPIAKPTMETPPPTPAAEAEKASPASSAARAAVTAILAGVVSVALVVV